jgi:hypothetical protein
MSRYETHIETGLVTKNGLFKIYPDSKQLYTFLKTNKFQIIGFIKSAGTFREMP